MSVLAWWAVPVVAILATFVVLAVANVVDRVHDSPHNFQEIERFKRFREALQHNTSVGSRAGSSAAGGEQRVNRR